MESSASDSTVRRDLFGKVAVVTGASKGIGRAIATQLLRRGCSILGTCSSTASIPLISELNEENVRNTTSANPQPVSTEPRVEGIVADVLSPTCAIEIGNAIETLFAGRVDILVLNAAITGSIRIGEDKPNDGKIQELQRFLVGNVQTPTLIVDELVRRKMFQEDSRIVVISSIRSKQAIATSSMYSATKAAGESLVRTWAEAFGGKQAEFAFMAGTTANAVQVGLTQTTALTAAAPATVAKYTAAYLPQQSLPRLAEPEDVADVVGFLCAREARWVTGSVVSASGGGVKIG